MKSIATVIAWGPTREPLAQFNSLIPQLSIPFLPTLVPNIHHPSVLARSADFKSFFTLQKLWSEGCLSWGQEGSINRTSARVFPQLLTNPCYLLIPLMMWFPCSTPSVPQQQVQISQSIWRIFVGVVSVGGYLQPRCRCNTHYMGLRKSWELQDSYAQNPSLIYPPHPPPVFLPASHTRVPSAELATRLCGMCSGNLRTHSHGQ